MSSINPGLLQVVSRTLTVSVALLILGCGGNEGPPRYEVSGSVTYDGQPVPAGEVTFEPDASQGNQGPGSIAQIKDGQYRTERNSGVVGGPYIVRIVGFDGRPAGESLIGTPLFDEPHETTVEFPKQNTTHDFHIPANP
jgi:hypothetical protein